MKKIHQPQRLANAYHTPNWLSQIPTNLLSFGAKALYARLCKWAGTDGKAYRSYTQLGKELGVSPSQIKRYLKDLKETELISTFHPQAGGVNHFTFYEHDWMKATIVDELLYSSDLGADATQVHGADTTLPQVTCDPSPGADATRIIGNKGIINTTTTIDQKLNKDLFPEPVVVSTLSLTPTPSMNVFISVKYDALLLEAYKKRPVITKNIKDELDYLSACKYEVDYRPAGISIPARVNQRIKFTLDGTFEEPVEWASEIVRNRNARMAVENLRRNEEATLARMQKEMTGLAIEKGREGFTATLEILKKSPEESLNYAQKNQEVKRVFRPYLLPEELQTQQDKDIH